MDFIRNRGVDTPSKSVYSNFLHELLIPRSQVRVLPCGSYTRVAQLVEHVAPPSGLFYLYVDENLIFIWAIVLMV